MRLINHDVVAQFVPETFDGDTFLYTELLDRSKSSGRNRGRRVQTFYHRDRSEFFEQVDQIIRLCDFYKVRAYTRLAPRSFRTVGMEFTKMIVEQSLTGNWEGMRHAYSHACGNSAPTKKRWLFDVDFFGDNSVTRQIKDRPEFMALIPSRKGYHIITSPFDVRHIDGWVNAENVELHKDNPTNLYIPDAAA